MSNYWLFIIDVKIPFILIPIKSINKKTLNEYYENKSFKFVKNRFYDRKLNEGNLFRKGF